MPNPNDYLPPQGADWPYWRDYSIDTWQTIWANQTNLFRGSSGTQKSYGWRKIFSRNDYKQRGGTEGAITTGDGAILDPILGDLASVSSDLLFGEPIKVKVEFPDMSQGDEVFQDYINDTITRMIPELTESAEINAAVGSSFIRVNWREDLQPYPLIETLHPQNVKGFFWGKILEAATIWTNLPPLNDKDDSVWRLFEVHYRQLNELNGNYVTLVEYFLARGDNESVGNYVSLNSHPQSAVFMDRTNLLNISSLDMTYTPNMLPRTDNLNSPLGRSDIAGAETHIFGLNDAYTGLWRDIRAGRRKVFAPREYFYTVGNDQKTVIDYDEEVMTLVNQVRDSSMAEQFYATNFSIRAMEHLQAAKAYWARIVTHAGYSIKTFDSTFTGESTGALSGTALRLLERRSNFTILKKRRYYEPAIKSLIRTLLEVDRTVFQRSSPQDVKFAITWPELYPPDLETMGDVAQALSIARAASIDTLVRMFHPEWTEMQVADEISRITQENVTMQEMPNDGTNNGIVT